MPGFSSLIIIDQDERITPGQHRRPYLISSERLLNPVPLIERLLNPVPFFERV